MGSWPSPVPSAQPYLQPPSSTLHPRSAPAFGKSLQLLLSRDLAPRASPPARAPRGAPAGTRRGRSRAREVACGGGASPRGRAQLRGGGAGAGRGEGRGCRDLLIAGVTGLTGPRGWGVCACSVRALALGAREPGRLCSSSPGASATVAAVGVSARCRREASLGRRAVAPWEWEARVSPAAPHAPLAARAERRYGSGTGPWMEIPRPATPTGLTGRPRLQPRDPFGPASLGRTTGSWPCARARDHAAPSPLPAVSAPPGRPWPGRRRPADRVAAAQAAAFQGGRGGPAPRGPSGPCDED